MKKNQRREFLKKSILGLSGVAMKSIRLGQLPYQVIKKLNRAIILEYPVYAST